MICQEVYDYIVENWASEEETEFFVDMSHFFGKDSEFDPVIYVSEEDFNAFEAQFPSLEIIKRCAVMKDYGEQTQAMNRMWRNVKA